MVISIGNLVTKIGCKTVINVCPLVMKLAYLVIRIKLMMSRRKQSPVSAMESMCRPSSALTLRHSPRQRKDWNCVRVEEGTYDPRFHPRPCRWKLTWPRHWIGGGSSPAECLCGLCYDEATRQLRVWVQSNQIVSYHHTILHIMVSNLF